MAKNVIPGGFAFSYRGRNSSQSLDLHRYMVSVSDNLKNRIARHVYLKRDGAEKEPMGSGDGSFKLRLEIVGADCVVIYRSIVNYVRLNPQGTLNHPLLGEIRVAAEGIDEGSMSIPNATNLINVGLTFSEDALDTALTIANFKGPATEQGNVSVACSNLLRLLGTASRVLAIGAIAVEKATDFAAAAVSCWQTGAPNAALGPMLTATGTSIYNTIDAIRNDAETSDSDAANFPAIDAAEQVLASCYNLNNALASVRPAIVTYVVPGTMPLCAIAAALYGKDAQARQGEILSLNRIANPFAVPGGTVLLVAQPST